ncbi:MAG: PIG-L family deacetylase [Actinomycetia bacterium]|nr:PIG-L family deacetylase [Actinomycetes bacterium]
MLPESSASPQAPPTIDLPTPQRALAVVAHPDDAEFQCGATLARWAAAGCEVSHLICTDGSKGTWDHQADQAQLVVTRQAEQKKAAETLGATGRVVFLGHTDGELDSGLRQRAQVAYWIRALRPTVVLGHDPWKHYRLHPDHRHAGLLVVEGVVAARDPFFFPEHEVPPHRPDALLLFEAETPDHLENVTGFLDTKVAALEAHASQFETTHGIDEGNGATRAAFRQRVADKLTVMAGQHGPEHAEAYKLITDL